MSEGEHSQLADSFVLIVSRLRTAYLNGTKPEDYQYQEMGYVRVLDPIGRSR